MEVGIMNKGLQNRYEYWLSRVEEWANKHSTSISSAISILADNSPTCRQEDLYYKEFNNFVYKYLSRKFINE